MPIRNGIYTPATSVVRLGWVVLAEVNGGAEDEARAEFDRWLASVKADAWDEGAAHYGPTDRLNPYREA